MQVLSFCPDSITIDPNALTLLILVNGTSIVLEFLRITGEGLITVSTIQQLQAGDIVRGICPYFHKW